ncbi:DUF262 domain-containing protein [Flavobacterium cupreum]|uniref:DUF262 domain-containing protein n=1 Tax=Flavobacterium cupreum TaxID=2133766 RepID=A0A434AC19_9FLAO|nr:DUF262 domain-containing protein [Flavobacterium cupreum]RUT71882.1 DUF262 domain-containing protein [Flavobacterium cupreum]
MNDLQINTRVRRLFHYLEDFEHGLIRVPIFQRSYKWRIDQRIKLFDSIKNGYPIGSILFWRPYNINDIEESVLEDKIIGSYLMNEKDQSFFYILDGFQRLSTIIGCLMNPEKTNLERDDEEWYRNFNIVYNLENNQFESNTKRNLETIDINKIPVYKLADSKEFFNFQRKLFEQNLDNLTIERYLKNYELTARKISDYLIPSIDLIGGDISGAIEIFDRVNSQGAKMSEVEKLSAQTATNDFRLGILINDALDKIEFFNFYDKKKKREAFRELIYRCVQSSFGVLYLDNAKTNVITLSEKNNFEEIVSKTLANTERVVQFLKEHFYVIDLKYLPANLHYIFLVEFFNINGYPQQKDLIELKRWFWKTAYSNYFTIYNPAKRKTTFEKFRQFALNNDNNPLYIDKELSALKTEKFPRIIDFGGVRKISLALFMVNYSVNKNKILDGISISFNNVKRVAEYKLFKSQKVTENVVFIGEIDNELNSLINKNKDLSFLLKSEYRGKYEELFITDEMRDAYDDLDDEKVLQLRLEKIIEEEEKFVKTLGIEYIK